MAWNDEHRQRIAAAVSARRNELGLSQAEAVARSGGGVSVPVWSILENGRQPSFKRRTVAAVCRALGWTTGSLDLIANGEPARLAETGRGMSNEGRQTLSLNVGQLRATLEYLNSVILEHPDQVGLRDLARDIASQVRSDPDLRAAAEAVLAPVVGSISTAMPEQFAVAAEGATGRAPKSAGRRVNRPRPAANED